jgi:hypothetical protein
MSTVNIEHGCFDKGEPVKDAPGFAEGDFELVSSDNVRFRIPSYSLQAAR